MKNKTGFALPTVLIAAVVMLTVLAAAVSVTVSIRSSLQEQRYDSYARDAANAGIAFAQACLRLNGNSVTWSNEKPLRPNTDCQGEAVGGSSAYVLQTDDYRSYFVVDKPETNSNGDPVQSASRGFVELLRRNNGIAWRVFSGTTVSAVAAPGGETPVGTSIEGYWTTAPEGYLLENGAAVSRTTYASLFAVIGTTFVAGDGSTTFNLPDSRGRVAVNKSTDTEFDVIGEKYGAKTHTLTVAEMPSHTHIQNAHNHLSGVAVTYGGNAGVYRSIFATNSPFWSAADGNNPVSSTTATNQNTGGGGAHNNIQPSIVVNRAIKY